MEGEIIERDGKKYEVHKYLCDCPCHDPRNVILHIMACCDNGYKTVEVPI